MNEWPNIYELIDEKPAKEGKKEVVGIVDCTPTWEGLLPMLLQLWQEGKVKVCDNLKPEFFRMAKAADWCNEFVNDEKLIKEIMKRKAEGQNCTDQESEKLKEWIGDALETQNRLLEIASLFPLQYGECAESFAERKFNESHPELNP